MKRSCKVGQCKYSKKNVQCKNCTQHPSGLCHVHRKTTKSTEDCNKLNYPVMDPNSFLSMWHSGEYPIFNNKGIEMLLFDKSDNIKSSSIPRIVQTISNVLSVTDGGIKHHGHLFKLLQAKLDIIPGDIAENMELVTKRRWHCMIGVYPILNSVFDKNTDAFVILLCDFFQFIVFSV